jgi:hypothetical protein
MYVDVSIDGYVSYFLIPAVVNDVAMSMGDTDIFSMY